MEPHPVYAALWRPKTSFVGGTGELQFKVADFPRTNRRVCLVELGKGSGHRHDCRPVRRSVARYPFSVTMPRPLLDLEFQTRPYWGSPFCEPIFIEHNTRR